MRFLIEQPGKREDCRGNAACPSEAGHFVDDVEILLEVVTLKARRRSPVIVFLQVFELAKLTGQKSSAQWAVGEKPIAESAASFEHTVLFGIACPERVLRLHGGDGVHGVGLAKRRGGHLRKADVPHLARAHEIGHGPHGVFDGDLGVDPMILVEVDVFDPEATQAAVDGFSNIGGVAPE